MSPVVITMHTSSMTVPVYFVVVFITRPRLGCVMGRVAAVVSNGCNPDPRVLREAVWLVEAGHDVTIHAFDRLQEYPEREVMDGITIIRHRVGYTPYGGTWSTVRGLRKFRNKVIKDIRESNRKHGDVVDLIHCHDADTLSVGLAITGAKVLFDMHDLHHSWVLMPNPRSIIRKAVSSKYRKKMLKDTAKVDAVVTSSTGFQSWLRKRGIESIVVENRPSMKDILVPASDFTVGYLGRVREVESFELLLQAVQLIPEKDRPRLLIAGDGNAAVQVAEMVRVGQSEGWLEAEVFGAFDSNQLAEMMQEISVMYALYPPFRGNIMDGALPVKMFDAASYGRPSVVNAGCHMAEVCESEGLGVAIEWADAQGLADSLVQVNGMTVQLSRGEEDEKDRFLSLIERLF